MKNFTVGISGLCVGFIIITVILSTLHLRNAKEHLQFQEQVVINLQNDLQTLSVLVAAQEANTGILASQVYAITKPIHQNQLNSENDYIIIRSNLKMVQENRRLISKLIQMMQDFIYKKSY